MNILIVHEVSFEKKMVYEYQEFGERLQKLGHNVMFIDFDEHGDGKYKEKSTTKANIAQIKLINTPFINLPIIKYISGKINYSKILNKKLKKNEIDIVFLYSVFINGTNTVKLCKKYNIPVVYRILDIYHKLRDKFSIMLPLYLGEKFIYKNVDKICLTNDCMRDYILRMTNSSTTPKLCTLNHGVDTDYFFPKNKNKLLLTQLGLNAKHKIALFLGTTYKFSGLDSLIKNFSFMKKKIPEVKLVIVGGGDLDAALKDLIQEFNLETDVFLLGTRPYNEVPEWISIADVTLLPFYINDITSNIVPIKVLQYLSCGKALISTPIQDVMRLFPEQSSGVIYASIDQPINFILQIIKVLTNDDLKKLLERNSFSHIKSNFSINIQMEKLEQILKFTLDEKKLLLQSKADEDEYHCRNSII